MKLTRRNFLAWAGISAIGAVACDVFQDSELGTQSPVQLPEDLVKGRDNWYSTLCRQCPSHEGILVRVMEGRAKKVQGNPLYPTNQGKQSARCDGGLQALYHPDRVSGPMRRVNGQLQPIDWDTALDMLRQQLNDRGNGLTLITQPLRGHLGLIASRFAEAFGGRHLGFEALDQGTYRTAVKNVFGQDLLPDFDFANSNRILSFGADFLSTWVSPTRWSVEYGKFRDNHEGLHIHVDPRFSMTAANADRWLPIQPGTEGFLALSLAQVIISEGLQASGVNVDALTGGQGAAALDNFSPDRVGPSLGLPEGILGGQSPADFIRELARDFAGHGPSIALGGDSAGAHTNGLFNLEAIYALNYLVGSVGQQGGIRFNPPSPLLELPASAQVGSLPDWTGLVDDMRGGATRLVMVHQADPVHGLPGSVGFRSALAQSDVMLISFSSFLDETSSLADLVLPDRVYLEDWGDDIPEPGPGYQVLGVQQPVVNPLSDLDPRSFADILLSVSQELGRDGNMPWNSFREALKASSDALFDMRRGSVSATSPDEFWNNMLRQGGWWDEGATGPSVTAPNGLFNQIAGKGANADFSTSAGDYYLVPFSHNTLLDGRNAHVPWAQATPDPITTVTWQTWVDISEGQAKRLGLREGDIVRVESSRDSIMALVYPNPAMPPNVVGVPLGQGHQSGSSYATAGDSRESSNVLNLLNIQEVQGSGALAWASHRVRIVPTGQSMNISKFEGSFPAREIGLTSAEEVFKTVGGNGH